MINKLVINLMASNDYQGFPQRWAIAGEAEAEDLTLSDDDLNFLDPDAPGADRTSTAQLQSGPGELWWMEGVKSVGQFPPAAVDAFLSPLRFILESMGSLTSTPTDFFMSADGSAPSGESRRVAHAPLTKKVSDRKQNFGSTWVEALAFAAVVGLDLTDTPSVDVTWVASETYDDSDSWAVASAKQEAGVPTKRTLVEQGYGQEDVDEWYPETESDSVSVDVLRERVDLLGAMADAAQKIGMAVQFGVLTAEQAQQTMSEFLMETDLRDD